MSIPKIKKYRVDWKEADIKNKLLIESIKAFPK